MNRGRKGEDVFECDEDRKIFIALLREAAKLWNVRISAYCLMSNHYHILAQTPDGNLSRFMRHLNGVYTQRFNRLHNYDGQLFRGRFKAILVEEDNNLLELVRYIHRNPLRAGMVEVLGDYPWSSHCAYLSNAEHWSWLYQDFILTLLTPHKRKRRQAYVQFMVQEDSEEILDIFSRKKWPPLLGSERFISWVKNSFYTVKQHCQVPESVQLAPDLEQIKRAVCRYYGVEEQEILTGQRGKNNEPRNVAIYLSRTLRNDTLLVIGNAFGMTGYSPAGGAIERIKKRLAEDRSLCERVEQIRAALLAGS